MGIWRFFIVERKKLDFRRLEEGFINDKVRLKVWFYNRWINCMVILVLVGYRGWIVFLLL